jgi:hypothetical protein
MNPLYPAAHEVQKFFRKKRWRFCIIGGLAVIRWGRMRATDDVDLCLLTGFGEEERVVTALLKEFKGRVADAHSFALRSRVVLCQASNGVAVDIALSGVPYEERIIERASKYNFAPRISLVTASAEDLIVLKAFAGRDGDWSDIRGVIERQHGKLDWDCIFRELAALCELKEDTGPLDRLTAIRDEEEQYED